MRTGKRLLLPVSLPGRDNPDDAGAGLVAVGGKTMGVRIISVAVFLVQLHAGLLCLAADWKELRDCVLVENAANDADSFHIRRGKKEYLLRLYFVDAPETNSRYPDRVREQAEWFGTTEAAVLHFGEVSTGYVKRLLGKPFTVYTQLVDARGASSVPRVFALVKVGDRFLCELLVEQGFARIYGMQCDLPDGTPRRRHERRLADLEKEAKWKKTGLWGGFIGLSTPVTVQAKGGRAAVPGKTVTLLADAPFYSAGALPVFRGYLRKGDSVRVISTSGEMATVQTLFRGRMEEGVCRRKDLGL